jgi:hypothetical protein
MSALSSNTRIRQLIDSVPALVGTDIRVDISFGVDEEAVDTLLTVPDCKHRTCVYEGYDAEPPFAIEYASVTRGKLSISAQRNHRLASTDEISALEKAPHNKKSTTVDGGAR